MCAQAAQKIHEGLCNSGSIAQRTGGHICQEAISPMFWASMRKAGAPRKGGIVKCCGSLHDHAAAKGIRLLSVGGRKPPISNLQAHPEPLRLSGEIRHLPPPAAAVADLLRY